MKNILEQKIAEEVSALFGVQAGIELTRPEQKHGDFATNVALQLSKQLGKNPREIGEELAGKLRKSLSEQVSEITVAGPGFLNLRLKESYLISGLEHKPAQALAGKVVVAEYSDPNPFKVLHVGHLYTSIVGDAIANLLQSAGGTVNRVNFGGDVGLHVAKTMWSILRELGGEKPDGLQGIDDTDRSGWMAEAYVSGNQAYDDNEQAKGEIIALNKRIYQVVNSADHDSPFAQIYWTCRTWSYDYFDEFYARIGVKFQRYYPESETAPVGLKTVQEQLAKGVYKESDGAVIFDGEPYGLHTRVFINSEGLPTYEAKDVGLIIKKYEDYKFDLSVVITANEIDEYMKVVLKSIEQFLPELTAMTRHLSHGMVKRPGGVKMGSRTGNILRATDILDEVFEANQKQSGKQNVETSIGAIKYAFLKHRMGGDLVYDAEESVSLEGNSGPYLQYAHARAKSILRKVEGFESSQISPDLEADERSLVRKITEFTEVVNKATAELMPHHVCTYLYELAQDFNRFYENNRVIDDPRQATRLQLVDRYALTLERGLKLLGIAAPEQM